ncbi:MAG TPA: peptidoglycan-binding domain-containing protein [Candidatus Acidoferrum sp.]|jgi:hypothetical protein|nr:peptidoglycan-binding domain-containing protein [Candidatus Acidoferrum sp.]
MPLNYKAKPGDCISSIAYEQGFFPDTIWNHPGNAELKQKRKDPNVLLPGDIVVIPDKQLKELSKPTEQEHRFKKKGVPAKLKLRLLKNNQPRKNEKYRLIIDGISLEGTTDGNGFLEKPLPPDAKEGKLIIGKKDPKEVFVFHFGTVDPLDSDDGVAERLRNLGYAPEENSEGALKRFQADHGLKVTGQADDATRNKLKEVFGQ